MKKIVLFIFACMIAAVSGSNELQNVVCFKEQFALQTLAGRQSRITPGHNSKYAVKLVTAKKGKGFSALSRFMLPRFEYSGSTAVVSADVRGSGKFHLGLHILYKDGQGKLHFKQVNSPVFTATSDYKKYEWKYQLNHGMISQMGAIIFSNKEKNEFEIDNFVFSLRNDKALEAQYCLVETAENKTAEVKFKVKGKLTAPKAFDGKKFADAEAVADTVTVKAAPKSNCAGVIDAGSGAFSNIFYYSPAEWEKIEKTAAKVKLKAPVRVLVIGDSLSDFDRGYNYVDMWAYRMNLFNQGKFYVRNAGIAGDYTTMALRRLQGNKNIFGAFRYIGLEKEKFDYVVVFLGHNDCRKTYYPKQKKYNSPVPPDRARKNLRELFSLLKKRYGAKIIAVTPFATDYEVSAKRVESAIKKNASHTIFGDVKLLGQYSTVLREAAAEFDAEVLDMFNISLKNPARKSLFHTDGVHLNLKGHQFMASELLNFSIKNIH